MNINDLKTDWGNQILTEIVTDLMRMCLGTKDVGNFDDICNFMLALIKYRNAEITVETYRQML